VTTIAITQPELARRIAEVDAQPDTDSRGKAFEEVAEFLFTCIGCPNERNLVSPMHSEQVDLAACHMGALDPLPNFFLVECKYWDKPLTSAAVGYFINTCASRQVSLGIIMSKEGLTGNGDDATYAHSMAYGASPRGVHIIVITLADLKGLTSNQDLVALVRRAWIRAVATGGIGLG
jgi:hypothetical protein